MPANLSAMLRSVLKARQTASSLERRLLQENGANAAHGNREWVIGEGFKDVAAPLAQMPALRSSFCPAGSSRSPSVGDARSKEEKSSLIYFPAAQWKEVVAEIERSGPYKVGRDCSFSSFRVAGSWRGKRSGVQILPPPADAPRITIHRTDYRSPMSTGSPTRMKKRAKACERCSRYGGRSRSRGWALF